MKSVVIDTPIGKILLSPMTLEDVHAQAKYLYESSPDFLTEIGFDLDKLPTRDIYINNLQQRIKAQIERPDEDKRYATMVGKLNDNAIGIVVLVPDENPETAHAHFHIWDESLRGKGLGKPLLQNGLKLLMDHQKRRTAFIEPHFENKPMNRLMEKCNFERLGFSEFHGPMTVPFKSCKYLIRRELL